MNTEMNLIKSCHLLTRQYMTVIASRLNHLGLERYFLMLKVIHHSPEPLTQKQLGEKLSVDKVTMVRIIDHLVKQGFVQRVQNPNDRREYHISLSEKGHQAIPEIQAACEAIDLEMYQNISDVDKQIFMSVLHKMQQNLKNI